MTAANPGRVYAYVAPGYDTPWERTVGSTTTHGRGKIKVGYTMHDSRKRIEQQLKTAYPDGGWTLLLDEEAIRHDGTAFKDHAVHKVLTDAGVRRSSEVFEATLDEVKAALIAVRSRTPFDPGRTADFSMRPEQADAVEQTAAYFFDHKGDKNPPRVLWNAKMRFGKTFSAYQLAKQMGWKRILVLTYKPAVRNAWRDDLSNHVDFTGWEYADRDHKVDPDTPNTLVRFASFQDLLSKRGGKQVVKERNEDIHLTKWDCVILDEYHFGAWQGAARDVTAPATDDDRNGDDRAEEQGAAAANDVEDLARSGAPRMLAVTPDEIASGIKADVTSADLTLDMMNLLYLSGTPFRALTEGEFNEDAIFNWTYPDEQRAKANWGSVADQDVERNPYLELPKMEMYTYALPGLAIEGPVTVEGVLDLSKFFEARPVSTGSSSHVFVDADRVHVFLNMITGKLEQNAIDKLRTDARPPFPYSDRRFASSVEHTVWFMPNVSSAMAMKDTLDSHPYFKHFLVHVAAGGDAKMGAAAKEPVDAMLAKAAKENKQTITLSVGKLMTGVTVPQWGSILILRGLRSPESYFQAAFRVQSPWTTRSDDGAVTINKETCFVFDFDPTRALTLIYEYGTKLAGSGDKSPADEVGALIAALPVFAFEGGRMDPVDVNTVMDWGTSGIGAAMLTKRWSSPRLINLSEEVLARLLADGTLVDRLEKIEDFRNLREDANKILAQSKKVRDGKAKVATTGEPEDPEVSAARKAKREQVKTLRSKLLKFVQAIPVFMYLTDFREEALVDVITSLDTKLFERVTGLSVDDFIMLSNAGVFEKSHMNEAIWQFRLFERRSLDYLDPSREQDGSVRLGGMDESVTADEAQERVTALYG